MGKALVLDANQRSALAITRSLGSRGIRIVTADYIGRPIGAASKYSVASLVYPDPRANPNGFIKNISEIVQRHDIDVVIPATDLTTMLLVDHVDSIKPAKLACPSNQSYEMLTDKRLLVSMAQELGISIPETRITSTASEIFNAAAEFGFPLVLKPSRSRYLKDNQIFSTTVQIANNPKHLNELISHLKWMDDIPCLVQKFIPGYGAGVFTVCGANGPLAWFAHRRIREKPPTGGVSVLSESVMPDKRLQDSAYQLLSTARWFGIAMVEFRVAADGTPYLMEVNGRFWGSLQLAIDCGVDFPWLLYRLMNNEMPSGIPSYAVGRRLRWLLGDMDNLILQLRGPQLNSKDKIKAIGCFLRSFFDGSCRQEIFRWHDPRPGLLELSQWFGALSR